MQGSVVAVVAGHWGYDRTVWLGGIGMLSEVHADRVLFFFFYCSICSGELVVQDPFVVLWAVAKVPDLDLILSLSPSGIDNLIHDFLFMFCNLDVWHFPMDLLGDLVLSS